MRLSAHFKLSGWFKKSGEEPEPLDVALRLRADLRAFKRRQFPVDGSLTALGLAQQAVTTGELGPRRLLLSFESEHAEALVLRAGVLAYREAPFFSLSIFDGHIETPRGQALFDIQLRFDFRHDWSDVLHSLKLRDAHIR